MGTVNRGFFGGVNVSYWQEKQKKFKSKFHEAKYSKALKTITTYSFVVVYFWGFYVPVLM
jgi:hypothetical protein